MRVHVDDPADPRLAPYRDLRDHRLRQGREAPGGPWAGLFVVEGRRVIDRALRSGARPLGAVVDARRAHAEIPPGLDDEVDVYLASPAVVHAITGADRHRHVLACFERPPMPEPSTLLHGARRVVVLEGVVNPTNVGVIVRSAAGLGWDAVLLDPTSADPLYRRATRAAMGEVFAIAHARLPPLPAGLGVVTEHGFTCVALTPAGDTVPLDEVPGAKRLALVVGSEGAGLTTATLAACDVRARIAMHRGVDSLNAGAAAAVALHALR